MFKTNDIVINKQRNLWLRVIEPGINYFKGLVLRDDSKTYNIGYVNIGWRCDYFSVMTKSFTLKDLSMSVIKHEAIIITGFLKDSVDLIHSQARKYFGSLVSDIIRSTSNNFYTFMIAPDGSKESMPKKREYNNRRKDFIDWLRANKNIYSFNMVHVSFGGDEDKPKIQNAL